MKKKRQQNWYDKKVDKAKKNYHVKKKRSKKNKLT